MQLYERVSPHYFLAWFLLNEMLLPLFCAAQRNQHEGLANLCVQLQQNSVRKERF